MDSFPVMPNRVRGARSKAVEYMRKRLSSSELPPGARLPSESQLCAQFGFSRLTARHALRQLIDEGVAVARPGKGYFVAKAAELPAHDSTDSTDSTVTALPTGRIAAKRMVVGVAADYTQFRSVYDGLFAELERRHPGWRFSIQVVPTSRELSTCAATCDVFQTSGCHLPWFVKNGLLFNPAEAGGVLLPRGEFFDAFAEGATVDGQTWGVPMIACGSVTYAREDSPPLPEGFWARLETLAGKAPPAGREAWINLNYSLFDMLALAGIRLDALGDIDERFAHPAFSAFLARLEPYLRAPGLFQKDMREPAEAGALFLKGRAEYSFGCSSWSPTRLSGCGFAWSVGPAGCEAEGATSVRTNINVISERTRYPEECVAVLRLLAEARTQAMFAGFGHCVANREGMKAMARTRPELARVAEWTFARGRLHRFSSISPEIENTYLATVAYHEIVRWYRGEMDWKELQAALRRKTRFFFRHENKSGRLHEKAAGA